MEETVVREDQKGAQQNRFLKYTFFKVARDWRFLTEQEREVARDEFLDILRTAVGKQGLQLSLFSLVGIRGDTDFLILADSPSLEPFQQFISSILSSKLGRHLDIPYSYLAMTRRSHYLGSHKHPGQEGGGDDVRPSTSRYIFVYPFIKKREWYKLPFVERQRMMAEHFKVGHKYPNIKINTGYSFGIDDQEFVLAFEGDDPADFLALVEELRGSDASMYTQLETPIFTCLRVDMDRLVQLLG